VSERIRIRIDGSDAVSGLLDSPASPRACYVFGHGAGAGMEHPFMSSVAQGLGERGIATLRYQFPYMERGSRRPDVPKVAHAAVRTAVAEAARRLPRLPTSQAQSAAPLPGVVGLLFFGFPLHPAGKPSIDRAQHLAGVKIPMLFVQGTRDELADASLIEPTVEALHGTATLQWVPEGDHSLHVPAKSGRSDAQVLSIALDAARDWVERVIER
jgi:predicted alpha/beta-hydrolase family hydrolase